MATATTDLHVYDNPLCNLLPAARLLAATVVCQRCHDILEVEGKCRSERVVVS